MKRTYLHLAALLLLAIITSCAKNLNDTTIDDKQEESSQVVLCIKTPSGFSSGAASRSLTGEDEHKIENIWVLAFNSQNELSEIRKGENLKDIDATTRSFTATLQRSKNATDTYNLMVLANAERIITNQIGTDLDNIPDKSYTAITALLNETIMGKMYASGGTIPMWGESGTLEIKLGVNNNISLSMLRSVARIDIGVGLPQQEIDGTYKWTGKDINDNKIPFDLKEVYVIKANNHYAVAPDKANVTDGKATAPTIPGSTAQFTIDQSVANFKYADAEIIASTADFGSYTTQSIYVPEADVKVREGAKSGDENHENRMAIVVGGDYNNSGRTTYYRLDLAKGGDILNALRNHLYQFNISKVSGFGYTDVETAYKSLSMNMQVDILDWDESEMGDVIFDGQNYFSISKSEVEFSPMGNESETIIIKTNVKTIEMWEERDGGEHMEMKLGGTTTYTNDDMGYKYTLTTVTAGSVYNLKIEATKHNVSNTVPNRLDKWRIKANRLNAKFEVDQQYTVLYVSYINGQSQNLYPEGTLANTISIDIMALKPVTIKAEENGVEATWIKLGNTDGLSNGNAGLYQARLEVEVDPFAYTPVVSTIRTGTITVTPQDEVPRVFTINQESPVFKFAKIAENVTRKPGTTYHTYVDIITNLPETDFKIVKKDSVGLQAWRIAHKDVFYNVDKTNPRSRRFDVNVDMQSNPPVFIDPFEKTFTATIDPKYGAITPPDIKFDVLRGDNHFEWNWKNAIIPPAPIPYDFVEGDNSMQYIFPWQTESATIHFNSNNGLEYYDSHINNKPRNGSIIAGVDIPLNDYITTPYTFTFNKANYSTTDNYDLYFKSTNTSTTTLVKNMKMGLGVQIWTRTPSATTLNVDYKGYPESNPYTLDVKSNVKWDATATSGDASFIKVRPDVTEAWGVLPVEIDDRIITPIETTSYNASTHLVKTRKMGIAIEPYNTINEPHHQVQVKFTNQSFKEGGGAGGGAVIANPTLTLTQYAPTLKYVSGAPTTTIQYYKNTYTITASTNIQSWGVRVYVGDDNTGTKLLEKAYGTSIISALAPTNRAVTVTIQRYNSSVDRKLSFYLYHTASDVAEKEVKIITLTQSWVDYITVNGLKWKRGNLIKSDANSCTTGSPNDAGLYFRNGSLIGWEGGSSGNGEGMGWPSGTYIATKPWNYYGGTSWGSVPYHNSGGFNYNPSGGKGDPCNYYLGGNWRTPTRDEYASLSYGSWTSYSGSNGAYAYLWNVESGIFFPASDLRNLETGALENVNSAGMYLSSTSYSGTNNWGLTIYSSSRMIDHWNRGRGYPVRCVSN